jgi:hypothetical protein
MSESPFTEESDDLDGDLPGESPPPTESQSWFEKLLDGDAPGPTIQELQSTYEFPKEVSIVMRGVLRVSSGSGVPPIAEIILGAVLWVTKQQNGGGSDMPTSVEDIQIDD